MDAFLVIDPTPRPPIGIIFVLSLNTTLFQSSTNQSF
jgi:hypothetical protein